MSVPRSRSGRLLGLVLACAVLAIVAAERTARTQGGGPAAEVAHVPKRLAYAAALPESVGWQIAGRACLLCHSAMLITQQAKDSTGWMKTLAQMEKWGAVVTPEERDTLHTYLLGLYGPRPQKPHPPAPRADSASAPSPPR